MISPDIHCSLRNKYNPDGSELRQYQLKLVNLLCEFDKICHRMGIKYWLSQGTVLGAVRHEGFIPWDDDIDVEMTYDDYKRFCREFIDTNRYSLQTIHSDAMYPLPFAKFRDNTSSIPGGPQGIASLYKFQGPFIDIFYSEPRYKTVSKYLNYFYIAAASCAIHIKNKSIARPLVYLLKNAGEQLSKLMRVVLSPFPGKKYGLGYGSHFYDVDSDINDLFPLSTLKFEAHQFPGPNNTNGYLTKIYGDYMRIPNSGQRKTHQ